MSSAVFCRCCRGWSLTTERACAAGSARSKFGWLGSPHCCCELEASESTRDSPAVFSDKKGGCGVSPRLERVRVPDTYPRERVVLGELHLLRGRLDGTLDDVAQLIAKGGDEWCDVEEAVRLARRALAAALTAAPPPPPLAPLPGELRVGELRVDPV